MYHLRIFNIVEMLSDTSMPVKNKTSMTSSSITTVRHIMQGMLNDGATLASARDGSKLSGERTCFHSTRRDARLQLYSLTPTTTILLWSQSQKLSQTCLLALSAVTRCVDGSLQLCLGLHLPNRQYALFTISVSEVLSL